MHKNLFPNSRAGSFSQCISTLVDEINICKIPSGYFPWGEMPQPPILYVNGKKYVTRACVCRAGRMQGAQQWSADQQWPSNSPGF